MLHKVCTCKEFDDFTDEYERVCAFEYEYSNNESPL